MKVGSFLLVELTKLYLFIIILVEKLLTFQFRQQSLGVDFIYKVNFEAITLLIIQNPNNSISRSLDL